MKKSTKLLMGSLSGAALVPFIIYAILLQFNRNTQPDITKDLLTWIIPYRSPCFKNGKEDKCWYSPILLEALMLPLKRAIDATEPKEPVAGGSCSDMQDYFNKNFGRRDTEFSNYEGIIESNVFNMLVCGGGVVIQALPTGKKTCTAWIRVLKDKTLDWYSESYADCFVSQ